MPAVNQIELHPYFGNDEVRAWGEEHGIATEAWSPIAKGDVLRDATVTEIARGTRPHAGAGRAPLASPARHDRLPEVGVGASGFARTSRSSTSSSAPDDVARIDALDRGEAGRVGPHPNAFG